jgi:hypothetical protein
MASTANRQQDIAWRRARARIKRDRWTANARGDAEENPREYAEGDHYDKVEIRGARFRESTE